MLVLDDARVGDLALGVVDHGHALVVLLVERLGLKAQAAVLKLAQAVVVERVDGAVVQIRAGFVHRRGRDARREHEPHVDGQPLGDQRLVVQNRCVQVHLFGVAILERLLHCLEYGMLSVQFEHSVALYVLAVGTLRQDLFHFQRDGTFCGYA